MLVSGKSATMSEDVIQPPKRPAMVVDRNPYGESRLDTITSRGRTDRELPEPRTALTSLADTIQSLERPAGPRARVCLGHLDQQEQIQ